MIGSGRGFQESVIDCDLGSGGAFAGGSCRELVPLRGLLGRVAAGVLAREQRR
jgi:hypothetical protein